ncbi:hypothetical protein [Legionella hackeliae]|uniref:Uncharacterized protein n=1 Tax=Legionella hackeliae TaxID=449 RepID=A0A0A8UQZ0_LEGHA|nr:hypothetical protein [Legionella hackeliae]KTD12860.1 hypothetical protein Lhac_1731 [Legionella hackeliae]CEK09164.1 protein of unknown function [Legionella hackeliae]STX49074.1 Uncharacterised protein [Legionella hackeliae]
MTILSKEALEKIRKERAERNEENADNIDALFRELDNKIEENKEEKEDYYPFDDDFASFPPDTD